MDPNQPAQPNPSLRPMNQPHIPISEAEMTHPQPGGNGRNTLLSLASLLVLAGVVGITLWLYIQNRTSTSIKTASEQKNGQDTAQKSTIPSNYVPTTVEEKRMAENLQKYGVVCKRFTSLEDALENPEIACILDLSGQELTIVPVEIKTLKMLNEINLSKNKISKFPSELLEMKSLLSLDLSNNKISSLPENTVIPPNIQKLNLLGNSLNSTDFDKYHKEL